MKISKKQKQMTFERRKETRQSLLREENLCSNNFLQKVNKVNCECFTDGTTSIN